MEATAQDQSVAIINNSIEIFRSAPEVLQVNRNKTAGALSVGNSILEQWQQAWAIESEDARLAALAAADERSNKYLVNCTSALKFEKESRSAITQMMDAFKKMFTDAENQIDKSKPDAVPAKVQTNRDKYAAEAYRISEAKRLAAQKEADKKKELIELTAQAETRLSNQYNDYLLGRKKAIQDAFNTISLSDFEERQLKMEGYKPVLSPDVLYGFKLGLFSTLHSQDDLNAITVAAASQKEKEFSANYTAELSMLRDELLEKLPSKKAELLEQKRLADEAAAEAERQRQETEKRNAEIANANAAEKKRLEAEAEKARIENEKRNAALKAQQEAAAAEQKQREDAENARLQNEAEEAKRKAEQEADIKKQGDQTMAMFEQEAAIAESVPTTEARQGYEIEVLHPVGYNQIFQLWFQEVGKDMPVDKIGNTKLDQMKAWAEKAAHKSGLKIEGKFLRYNESFKAVNRKA